MINENIISKMDERFENLIEMMSAYIKDTRCGSKAIEKVKEAKQYAMRAITGKCNNLETSNDIHMPEM